MKYKAVATNGTAAMQSTTTGVVRKIKHVSVDCVSTCFFGYFSVTDRRILKLPKKRSSIWSKCHFQTYKNVQIKNYRRVILKKWPKCLR